VLSVGVWDNFKEFEDPELRRLAAVLPSAAGQCQPQRNTWVAISGGSNGLKTTGSDSFQ